MILTKTSGFLRGLVFLVVAATLSHAACTGYAGGNWVIGVADNCANSSETIYLSGNLTVSGVLNLTNVTIIANTTYNGSIGLTVNAGGSLKLNDTDDSMATTNDASNLTANNSVYRLKFESYGGLVITHSLVSRIGFSNNGNTINNFGIALFSNYSNFTYNNFSYMFAGIYPGSDDSQIAFTNISYNYFNSIDATAVRLQNGTNSTIEGNQINANAGFTAIYLSYGSHYNRVVNNSFSSLSGIGVDAYLSNFNTIENNTFQGGTQGIKLDNAHNNTVTNNTANASTLTCIAVYDSENATVQNNTFSFATYDGAYLNNASYCYFNYNTIENNSQYGIYDYYGVGNTLFANIIRYNTNNGIAVYNSNYSTLSNNSIILPASTASVETAGVYIYSGYYNVLDNNTITKAAKQLGIGTSIGSKTELSSNAIYGNNTVNAKQVRYFGMSEYACPDHASVFIGNVNTSAITLVGCNNVTIADGSISNGDGIALYFTNNSRVNNATVNYSWAGALYYNTENCTVTNSTLYNNTYGVYSSLNLNLTAQRNAITNTTTGVYSFVSLLSEFSYNNITLSDTHALYSLLSIGNNFSYNNFTNSQYGTYLDLVSTGNTFQSNNFSYNSVAGVYLSDAKSNIFRNNAVAFNNNGYSFNYSQNSVSLNNTIWNDRVYNNTVGVYFNNASGNNFTGVLFDNNSFHAEFNASLGNYITNSTFATHLTNQTRSNNSASDTLLNNTGVEVASLGFEDSLSNATIAYFVDISVLNWATHAALSAAVSVTGQASQPLYSLTSPRSEAITPVYLAQMNSPVNYTPHSFAASLSGFSPATESVSVGPDESVIIYLAQSSAGASSSTTTSTPSPTPTPSPAVAVTPSPIATLEAATPTPHAVTAAPSTTVTEPPTPSISYPSAIPTEQAKVELEQDLSLVLIIILVLVAIAAWLIYKSSKKHY